jgi:Uma2 family endonuclease
MTQPALADMPPTSEEYRLTMSYEEFLEWSDEDTHAEWVNGEVIVFMPPSIVHQDIISFLDVLISQYARFFDLGKVLIAPFEMLLIPGYAAREPDLAFIARDHLHRVKEKRVEGPADLVIEVISKESVTRDRRDKYHEYAQAGVQEYWIIDPRPRQRNVSCYQRTAQCTYQPILPDTEGRVHSDVLDGFWFRPAWLWQEPFPHIDDLLHEIIGEAYAQWLIESLRKRGFLPASPEQDGEDKTT